MLSKRFESTEVDRRTWLHDINCKVLAWGLEVYKQAFFRLMKFYK